jgi:hypothetical protein
MPHEPGTFGLVPNEKKPGRDAVMAEAFALMGGRVGLIIEM